VSDGVGKGEPLSSSHGDLFRAIGLTQSLDYPGTPRFPDRRYAVMGGRRCWQVTRFARSMNDMLEVIILGHMWTRRHGLYMLIHNDAILL
jgi:hypothetical protein